MEQKTEAYQAVKFRKKPVEIEAIQWTGSNLLNIIEFTDGRKPDNRHDFAAMKWDEYAELVKRDGLKIFTLEGKMNADVGDWIIKGVKNEFYPCKPDIFELTYERAALKAQPAPTEAAQGGFLVRVTPMNPEYADVHPELALEDALRVNPYGWPDGFQFEVVSAQSNTSNNSSSSQPSGNTGELARGEDSARLDDLATIRDLDRLGMELGAKLAQMVGHLDNGVEYLPRDAIMIAVTDWRSAWSKNAKARKPINRARASAETGGVKP